MMDLCAILKEVPIKKENSYFYKAHPITISVDKNLMFNIVGRHEVQTKSQGNLKANPRLSGAPITNGLIVILLMSALFAAIGFAIDWAELRGYNFIDRTNYINYFSYSENVLAYTKLEYWYQYLSREVLWHISIPWLQKDLGLNIHTILNSISFLSLFTAAFVLTRYKPVWSILFLCSPLLITLSFDQLRIALAFSLLVWAYLLPKKFLPISILLCVLSPLFHTSSVLFLALFGCLKLLFWCKKTLQLNHITILISLVLTGATMSFLLGEALHVLLELIGDRRANIYVDDASSGIKYTSFWILLLLATLAQPKSFFDNLFNCYSVIILSFVTFNLIFGGYSLRFLAVSLPFLMITKIANYRMVVGCLLGMIAFSSLLNFIGSDTNPMFAMPWYWHMVIGGYAFGLAFMVVEPVSGSHTNLGRYIYGALIGVMVILIRVLNPAFPEGIMLAILFGNVFAPLIDYFVVQANIKRRKKRHG